MNRRTMMKMMSRALVGTGAASLLPNCATTGGGGGGGALPQATKENPFVNSLGMKFVPVPGTKILMCTTETTIAQMRSWKNADFAPTEKIPGKFDGNHPAQVLLPDAKKWCSWISRKEGRRYRLPTDAEWSIAAGNSTYPWGSSWPPLNGSDNIAGQEFRGSLNHVSESQQASMELSRLSGKFPVVGGYRDNHIFTSPVASYRPNSLGIHDMGGNLMEWCGDAMGEKFIVRGGYWGSGDPDELKRYHREHRYHWGANNVGFRCVIW